MYSLPVVSWVGYAATVLGVVRAWPQAYHIVTRSGQGVSGLTWLLSLAAAIIWTAIGISHGLVPTISYNVLAGIGSMAVLIALIHRSEYSWVTTSTVIIGVVAGTAFLLRHPFSTHAFGMSVLDLCGFGLTFFIFLPQALLVALRPGPGVSILSWSLALMSSVLWSCYGIMTHTVVLLLSGIPMSLWAALIIWRSVTLKPAPGAISHVQPAHHGE